MKFIEMPLESRSCECCGSNDLDSVWSNQSVVVKAVDSYLFKVFVVICRKCGFCFTSPICNNEFLGKYYTDGLSRCKDIMLPYSVAQRVSFLKKYSVPDGIFVEIGGDQPDEFHKCMSGFFKKMINVEVTANAMAEYININDTPADFADVIAHYDVLEHVPQITEFLTACNKILKENGLMICEVPDIRLYHRNLVLLEYEHVNHFSTATLSTIAANCGFRLLELGHICSRPFGFVAVFRKISTSSINHAVDLPFEYVDALACIQGAIQQINGVYSNIKSIQDRITALAKLGKKITIWCVTDLLHRLIDNYQLPENAIVVDTDPRRQTHLLRYDIEVLQPKHSIEHISNSDLLVICAPRYKIEILEWINRHTGKSFSDHGLQVMGTGPYGESLI